MKIYHKLDICLNCNHSSRIYTKLNDPIRVYIGCNIRNKYDFLQMIDVGYITRNKIKKIYQIPNTCPFLLEHLLIEQK